VERKRFTNKHSWLPSNGEFCLMSAVQSWSGQ